MSIASGLDAGCAGQERRKRRRQTGPEMKMAGKG